MAYLDQDHRLNVVCVVGNHIGIHMAKEITQEELRELYSNRETSQPIASSTWHDVNHAYGAHLIMHREVTRVINH